MIAILIFDKIKGTARYLFHEHLLLEIVPHNKVNSLLNDPAAICMHGESNNMPPKGVHKHFFVALKSFFENFLENIVPKSIFDQGS